MEALGQSLGRRGFGYMVGLSLLVIMVGAAGMYAFERDAPDGAGFDTYGTALWWTAMLLTTMGSDYWPKTSEGRLLCWVLALYSFAVFGYVTASLASFFVGRDADADGAPLAGKASVRIFRRRSLRCEKRCATSPAGGCSAETHFGLLIEDCRDQSNTDQSTIRNDTQGCIERGSALCCECARHVGRPNGAPGLLMRHPIAGNGTYSFDISDGRIRANLRRAQPRQAAWVSRADALSGGTPPLPRMPEHQRAGSNNSIGLPSGSSI